MQGVGFRPFVYGLALRHELAGFVLNDGDGVLIEAQGPAAALDELVAAIEHEAPSLAQVQSVTSTVVPLGDETGFAIAASSAGGPASALLPADIATCDDCLAELYDPRDRRYRYPFVNCTQCGPRFTIVRSVPYDRPNTTMAGFPLCTDCRLEYEDPADRRFHAEPIACPVCGPRLSMPLEDAVALLRQGAILAVKGLGGYHLACAATDEEAVARLRARKQREDKPFAVMTSSPDDLALLEAEERELLWSRERPIVLVHGRDGSVAASVAPGTSDLGLMLPYTPLHHLLLGDLGGPLVMTSGNRSDEPIAYEDGEARERLAKIADAFLAHDRPIHRRCEDSVVRSQFPLRRSRGLAPAAIPLPHGATRTIVATGAELKSTFCVVRGAEAFLSPHLGDLETEAAYHAFRTDLDLYLAMLDVEPTLIAHDLHPGYLSTSWALARAEERDVELVGVQHHHAHAAACLAEHGVTQPALALVFDGTGFGPDGTLWGGELLRCDLGSYDRVAHLAPVPLPGGEAAIREPWRMAAAYLELAGRPVRWEHWDLVRSSLQVNAPLSSGMGRLFDAVAAVLGLRDRVTYEGQAAIELEQLAAGVGAAPYPCRVEHGVIHGVDLVATAFDDLDAGRSRPEIAAAFQEGVAYAAAAACLEADAPRTVVLSGGTFQNVRLLASTRRELEHHGFTVLSHRLVPPNDGGVSYGQAAVAASIGVAP